MSTNNTYLAVFLGSKSSPRRAAWDALPEGDRRAKEREGMAAWKAWVDKHHAVIVSMGGRLRLIPISFVALPSEGAATCLFRAKH
jgi:hypothetical protein